MANELIKNKLLVEWIQLTYPMMDVNNESDLSELDFYDMDKYTDWLMKKTFPTISNTLMK